MSTQYNNTVIENRCTEIRLRLLFLGQEIDNIELLSSMLEEREISLGDVYVPTADLDLIPGMKKELNTLEQELLSLYQEQLTQMGSLLKQNVKDRGNIT